MAQWGAKDNIPTAGSVSADPKFIDNFTGDEGWRYVADLTCKQLRTYVRDGMELDEPGSTTQSSPGMMACMAQGAAGGKALNCSQLSFEINCEELPNGIAVYNQVDTDNCDSWILMLAANGYNRTFMWIIMLILLLWTFLGVNIVADVFMAAIEVITAQTKVVKKVRADGQEVQVKTKVWNPTVANLSLMALGSSAPEIMLAVLDTVQTLGQTPGELGPSTIVGSAAFNLFVISAVCVTALPEGEKKKIEQVGVFGVTATFSILAYVWMVVVLSDENIAMWEALVTFSMFPILLCLAYAADKGLFGGGGTEVDDSPENENSRLLQLAFETKDAQLLANKEEIAMMIKEEQAKGNKSSAQIAQEMVAKAESNANMSRNHYRINAMKGMSGGRRAVTKTKSTKEDAQNERMARLAEGKLTQPDGKISATDLEQLELIKDNKLVWVFARNTRMAAFENEGSVALVVERIGCLDREVTVEYCTEDETAEAGEDYGEKDSKEPVKGTLVFPPDVTEQLITVPIIDDNQWEPDETFLINLSNAQFSKMDGDNIPVCTLRSGMEKCVVTIIDDDEPGVLGFFDKREYIVAENCGQVELNVMRKDGADGTVTVHYETVSNGDQEHEAIEGVDFKASSGTIVFNHQELSQTIPVEIIDTNKYDKNVTFQIVLTNPGGGALVYKKGGYNFATVQISNDGELAETVNNITAVMQKRLEAFKVSTSTWQEQFVEAFEVEGGTDEDGEDGDPSTVDYLMHFLTIFWKVLFAFIPPTDYCGGWLTFIVSLMFIGIVTGVVGAFAEMFGCFVGLKDSVTAITFVALGTSLPDTFASKHAALDDASADAAIGNVTGSNSVNVFLGLGLPWVIAVVWAHSTGNVNQQLDPPAVGYYVPKGGGLPFSVAVFCCEACVCVGGLCIRRVTVGGELGGPLWSTRIWGLLFLMLWFVYIGLSIMIAYGEIDAPSWL